VTRAPDPRGYLGALGGLGFVVMFLASLIVPGVAATAAYPRPDADVDEVQAYFAENTGVVGGLSLMQAAAAMLLIVFTGAVAAAVRRCLDRPSPEGHWAALGGGLAAAFLLLAALVAWAVSQDSVFDSGEGISALHQLIFAAGGAGHVASLGVFVGASSLAALRYGIHSRWLAIVGMGSAALSLASLVTLLVLGPAAFLIPLGRFTAFFYSVVVSLRMLAGRLGVAGQGSTVAAAQGR
jgi:hypothetical protein